MYVTTLLIAIFFVFLQNLLWLNGWPLSVSGAVVLHLGALDESLLRPHDLYICVKALPSNDPITAVSVQLCAVWRSSSPNLSVIYHELHPDRTILSPIALEMLAEELPQLLQSLLVGVEHAINRVPLDELTLFHGGQRNVDQHTSIDDRLSSAQSKLILSPLGSPKCGLKRRELINKSKLSNKYSQKRMSGKGGECERTSFKSPPNDVLPSVGCVESSTCTTPEPVCMLPLFCLGRSFPHIDSDEESGDDTIKLDTGKQNIIFTLYCNKSCIFFNNTVRCFEFFLSTMQHRILIFNYKYWILSAQCTTNTLKDKN